jgi:hypothetical protein
MIIAAVAAIAGLIYLIVTNWDKISNFFDAMFGKGKIDAGIKFGSDEQTNQMAAAYGFGTPNEAPNAAALAAGSWNGRLDIAGAPKGSTLAQASRGTPNFTAGLAWGEN